MFLLTLISGLVLEILCYGSLVSSYLCEGLKYHYLFSSYISYLGNIANILGRFILLAILMQGTNQPTVIPRLLLVVDIAFLSDFHCMA